jgi:putative DNA primase/helicase
LYPKASLVILADIGNGQTDAQKAAQLVSCRIAVPVLPEGSTGKDFNDMMIACGPIAVSDVINKTACAEDAWTEPEPFDDSLPSVPTFDYTMLPEKVRDYVRDSSERMQCPPDYVAVSMMAALGSVIGRRVGVRPKREDNWTEFANLWGMLIGRPSMKKSPAMNAGFAGLYKLQKKAAENYAREIEQNKKESVVAEIRNKQIKHNIASAFKKDVNAAVDAQLDEPVDPVLLRYTSNNFSPEAVIEVLRHNPNGLLCWEDELIGLLKRWNRDGQEDSRGLFLTGWSGKMPYTTDRIGRGMNLHVPAVCLSVFGTTQPGVIADFVRAAVKGGTGDDGLIQRFGLMVYPDKSDESEIRFIDQRPNLEAQREMEALFEYIVEAAPEDFGAEQAEIDSTPYLRLDGEAYLLFKEWHIQNERRTHSGDLHPAMESHLSKYNKLVLGLALICHIANGCKGAINEVAMLQALSWTEYLEPHAHRVFFAINNVKTEAAKSLLRRIRKGELFDGFTVRDVYRKGWAYTSTQEDAQQAIDLLVEKGYLAVDSSKSNGRPTIRYLVNPRGS